MSAAPPPPPLLGPQPPSTPIQLHAHPYTCTPTPNQALGSSQLALEAYTSAIALDPTDRTARDNLNKLPVGPPYKGMAAYETKVLAAP